jgi:acetolactate synthase-1/2/3 large subunit
MSFDVEIKKYSDQVMSWLVDLDYKHCFYLGGGNCMHLVDSANKFFETTPVVHEVSAGIAAEYFTDLANNNSKAFAVVTAGPGVTNIVSAVSAAWLESRPLLIIAGQAKTDSLSTNGTRQIGHQEIDAVSLMKSMTKVSIQLSERVSKVDFLNYVNMQFEGRPGPVFIEICLDITSMPALSSESDSANQKKERNIIKSNVSKKVMEVVQLLQSCKQPIFLFGGGVSREVATKNLAIFEKFGIPIAVTWNGSDRVGSEYKYYCGRPNTYGMRYSNILISKCDLLVTFGTRLGIQQTGFAWNDFAPNAKIVQIEIDKSELYKGFPKVDIPINCDANHFINDLGHTLSTLNKPDFKRWHEYIDKTRGLLPRVEHNYKPTEDFVEPYRLIEDLNKKSSPTDVWVSCSSGGTFTAFMQVVESKTGQKIISSKGLASMGFGLAGSIGAAFANPDSRIILTEGDGGFAQNLQELGTMVSNDLNIKIFLMSNDGYASIRTSQKSYFEGNYLGCDSKTGLYLPNWEEIAKAFNLNYISVDSKNVWDSNMIDAFANSSPTLFIINVDPEQPYLPKVTSRILEDGSMVSNPIHKMFPPLSKELEIELGLN